MNKKWPVLIFALAFLLTTLISTTNGDCSFPKRRLPHGRFLYPNSHDISLTVVPENYLLRFRCHQGYTLQGSQRILCLKNRWSDKVPKCIRMLCDNPPLIKDGSYNLITGTDNKLLIGSRAVYSCHHGYVLINSNNYILTCNTSTEGYAAVWIGEVPGCKQKETCPDPGVSVDGKRSGNSLFLGDTLHFTCNKGFELVGKESIQCFSGSRWSSLRPLCRPFSDYCLKPPSIIHGTVKGEKEGDYYLPDDEVEVLCDPGYSYNGSLNFMVCEEEGKWSDEFKECTEIFCDYPDNLENGEIPEIKTRNATKYPFNFEISYICNEGYRLIGDSWRFCDKRGWTGETPHCEVINCPDPGVPEHGTRLVDNFNIGAKVVFKCFSEYNLIGSFERYCMPNGRWSGELARCDHDNNYCADPGTPVNGMKNSSIYDMGKIINFQCMTGYTLLGSETRECLPDREWLGSEAKCVGPYDFDNVAQVSDILLTTLEKKEAEHKRITNEYTWQNDTSSMGKVLNLNFPGRLILYFAFDVSGSVGLNNFRNSIEFAKAIVKRIGISEIGARAGALTFSSKAQEEFVPVTFKTTEEVLDALDKIKYTGGGTSASSALALIRTEMIPLTAAVLSKIEQKSIIFILTDGKANMGGDPQQEADLLKQSGAEIYCVGITSAVFQDSLYKIASENEGGSKEEHVFILQNYASMSWLVQKLTNGKIDYSQCGLGLEKLGKQTSRGKIVGGRQASEPWPWMAALYIRDHLFCSGSIIHEKIILTAAHCLYTYRGDTVKENYIVVKLGLTNMTDETYMEVFEVEQYFIHQKYRLGLIFDYDIALLQLKKPIVFSALIRPVCIPPMELSQNSTLYEPGQYSVATGWGHASVIEKGQQITTKSEDNLKEVILPIQSKEKCLRNVKENVLRNIPSEIIFTEHMMCAGDGNGGNDTCMGDSGGPLMQSQLNSEGTIYWTQVGIVSWGTGCGLQNTYGYYTHTRSLYSWISRIIQLNV